MCFQFPISILFGNKLFSICLESIFKRELQVFTIIFHLDRGKSRETNSLFQIFHFFDRSRTLLIAGMISLSHETIIALS